MFAILPAVQRVCVHAHVSSNLQTRQMSTPATCIRSGSSVYIQRVGLFLEGFEQRI